MVLKWKLISKYAEQLSQTEVFFLLFQPSSRATVRVAWIILKYALYYIFPLLFVPHFDGWERVGKCSWPRGSQDVSSGHHFSLFAILPYSSSVS